MLKRTIKVGNEELLLLGQPYETKFFKRLPHDPRPYCIVHIKNDRVIGRKFFDSWKQACNRLVIRGARLEGKPEKRMRRELFSLKKSQHVKKYRRRHNMDAHRIDRVIE